MTVSLSPFRYIQVARYLIQLWLDARPGWQARKRAAQERAARIIYAPRRARALTSPALAKAEVASHAIGEQARGMNKGMFGFASAASWASAGSKAPLSDMPPILGPDERYPAESREIYRLMNDPRAFMPGDMQPPKEIVVLCHGLYGFSTATPIPLFPSLKLHYWASVLGVLRDRMGAKVVVVGVKGTGSIKERAEQMHAFLKSYLPKGVGVNFVAHSMGGLDCRHLISTIKPTEYKPLSLTTIATPHHGSPFMDWCAANIGVGTLGKGDPKNLPYSLNSPLLVRDSAGNAIPGADANAKKGDTISNVTSALTNYLLNIFDSPAYSNLTTSFLRDEFNPMTPDDPSVKYYSVAGRLSKMSVLHPLWFPKLVLDSGAEKGYPAGETAAGSLYEGNDGLVSVASAKWGQFLGVVDGCHHWDLRGEGGLWPQGGSLKSGPDGRPDPSMPGGWDWQGRVDLGSASADSSSTASLTIDPCADGGASLEVATGKKDQQLDAKQHARDLATATAMSSIVQRPSPKKDESSSWDLAQVGQLIDWVADLFPGDKKHETPTHQLADATKEKADSFTTTAFPVIRSSATDVPPTNASNASGLPEGMRKVVRDKFDLQRFYGGLMLRLREEGL